MKKTSAKLAVAGVLLAALALGGLLAGPSLGEFALRLWYPRQFAQVVSREAAEFRLPEDLVYAVIRAESGFDERASSRAQAKGLMQLTDDTFLWMAEEYPPENGGGDVFDVNDNVHCGCALLRRLLDHYGDFWLEDPSLSPDGAQLKRIPFPETAAYVEKVEKYQGVYQKLYSES